jgi:hypothetical protein
MNNEHAQLSRIGHLARRFVRALSPRPPGHDDIEWANAFLLPREADLWHSMSVADQRHSIEVARRFSTLVPESPRDDMAAALLHDVGKLASGLGTFARVAATLIGPRTRRFRQYHDHERLGVEMLHAAGSSHETLALLADTSPRVDVVIALRHADDV